MAIGDIGALIDFLEWDAVEGNMPSVCHVSGDVYAVAYWGPGTHGVVSTFTIDATGNIGAAIIDSWEFDATYGSYPEIIKVYETIYAIAYTDTGAEGQLVTFAIANDGTITHAAIDTGQYSVAGANAFQIIKITDAVFAIVYMDAAAHGWLQTVSISNAGTVLDFDIDKTEFDGVLGREGHICNVSGPVYAIAYRGPGDDGFVMTLSINDLGAITDPSIDSLEFDIASCVYPTIAHARDDFFAIAYAGPPNDGWLVIVTIDTSGNITSPITDSYEFDILQGLYPYVIELGDGYIALTYCKTGSPLWLSTFLVDAAGSLNATTVDTKEIDAGISTFSILFLITGNYYGIVYCGPGGDGWVRTITIDTPVSAAEKQHLMIIGVG